MSAKLPVAAWMFLAGCGGTITNQPFLDEAEFLGALPCASRLAAPQSVLLAPKGTSVLLQRAKAKAADWDAWWSFAVATGEELRLVTPDERTDVVRRWDGVNVASRINGAPFGLPSGQPFDWWVQVEIVRPGDGDVAWTIALALDPDGPFFDVGAGNDRGGEGDLTWDLASTAVALKSVPPARLGALDAEYLDPDAETGTERSASALYRVPAALDAVYGLIGEDVFGFTDPLSITDDGGTWPGFTTARHTPDGGGRADGVVGPPSGDLSFGACWDADGGVSWQGGDPGITTQGDPSACLIDSLDPG